MEIFLFSIFLIVGYVLILENLYFISSKTLTSKYIKSTLLLARIISIIILYLINISGLSTIKTILILAVYFLFIFFLFEDKKLKKLLVSLYFALFTFVSELLTANIVNLIFEMNTETSRGSFEFFIAIILSNIFLFLFCYVFITLYKFYNINMLPKTSYIILLLPITTIVFIFNIQEFFYLFRNNVVLMITLLGLIISNFVTTYFFYKSLSSIYYKNELNVLQTKENHIKKEYQLLEHHYNQNFNFTHDILKKSIIIKQYYNDKNFEFLDEEIEQLINISYKQFNMIYTNCTSVNTLLNDNIDVLNKNKIDFSTTISYNDFTFLSNLDEFRLFDCLINMSIESAIKNQANQKDIILKTRKLNQQVIIEIIYPDAIEKLKTDQMLREIEHLVKKNKGVLSLKKRSTNTYNELIILFPCRNGNTL